MNEKQPAVEFDPFHFWDEKKVAAYLGVSVKFVQQDRTDKRRIPFVKLGRAVRYDPKDVKAYAESCKVCGVPDEAPIEFPFRPEATAKKR